MLGFKHDYDCDYEFHPVQVQFMIVSSIVFYEIRLIMVMGCNPVWEQLVKDNDYESQPNIRSVFQMNMWFILVSVKHPPMVFTGRLHQTYASGSLLRVSVDIKLLCGLNYNIHIFTTTATATTAATTTTTTVQLLRRSLEILD